MNSLSEYFVHRLKQREEAGNRRTLKVFQKNRIDFASNDYLGLLHSGILHSLITEENRKIDSPEQCYGATGSRLLTGHSSYYEELEQEIVRFHQAEAGLMFNCGYLANLGLLSTITRSEDTVIYDIAIHASFHDSLKWSRVNQVPFRHQDLDHLKKRLKMTKGRRFVCIESVYSSDGTLTPLEVVHELCEQEGAHLIVDEAHATGCLGEEGRGAVHQLREKSQVLATIHTFGKALGGQGAMILSSSLLREYLINFSRPFIYTTALPLQNLVTIRCGYRALQTMPGQQQKLQNAIAYFRMRLEKTDLPFIPSESAIQCLRIPGNQVVKQAARWLQDQGFNICPLLSPTVRRGEECLRICLHAFNTSDEIDHLLQSIEHYLSSMRR